MNIAILILGITGDLSKRKILPAVREYADLTSENLEIIGYSRSTADKNVIESIISGSKNNVTLSLYQGMYDDAEAFKKIFTRIQEEKKKLVVYLAVPPHIIIPFIKNICPLQQQDIDIIIEKPFGKNKSEGLELIETIQKCSLTHNIFFFDHYRFKSATFLNKNQAKELTQFAHVKPKKITVRAVESLGIGTRKGYYNSTGALKDMWQHLQSLVELYAEIFGIPLNWKTFTIQEKVLGQYESYQNEISEKSQIETYFSIKGTLEDISIHLESGKKTGLKDTSLRIDYTNGTTLHWNIDPMGYIETSMGIKKMNELVFNKNTIQDHTRLFQKIEQRDFNRFVSPIKVRETWEVFELIREFSTSQKMILYPDDTNPYQK